MAVLGRALLVVVVGVVSARSRRNEADASSTINRAADFATKADGGIGDEEPTVIPALAPDASSPVVVTASWKERAPAGARESVGGGW